MVFEMKFVENNVLSGCACNSLVACYALTSEFAMVFEV